MTPIAARSRRAVLCDAAMAAGVSLAAACGPLSSVGARKRVVRIAVLEQNDISDPAAKDRLASLRDGLRELGYIEGETLSIDARGEADVTRVPAAAADLISRGPDVIITGAAQPATALRAATTTIPIVVVNIDVVATGLVSDLAHPGGNITGLTGVVGSLDTKTLQLVKEIAPTLSRVGVFTGPGTAQPARLAELKRVAPALGVQIQELPVKVPQDLDAALGAASSGRSEALMILATAVLESRIQEVAAFALANRILAVSSQTTFPAAGGLLSYGPNSLDQWRRAASYVDRIIKGAQPADLPIEAPTKIDLTINMNTAKALGLTIPPSVLAQATDLIQ